MLTTISNLILINLFVCLVHEAGFFETIDGMISQKYKFRHLPYIFLCGLCQTFWLSLLYIVIAGPVNLLTIALCLVNAHLTKIITPLYKLMENLVLKVIELLNKWLRL